MNMSKPRDTWRTIWGSKRNTNTAATTHWQTEAVSRTSSEVGTGKFQQTDPTAQHNDPQGDADKVETHTQKQEVDTTGEE